MATTVHDPKIGQCVYRIRQPQNPGKVIGSRMAPNSTEKQVNVLWLSGEESWISQYNLRDLDALIQEQKRTLDAHRSRRDKLEKL